MHQPPLSDFPYQTTITTRWHDNDVYGHVNNVIYYSFFDSAVNKYLIEEAGLDIHNDPSVAYVVSSSCQYYASLSYPEIVTVGVRVAKLGNASVHYELVIYGQDGACKASGEFVHVFVDRDSNTSISIPTNIRKFLENIAI